MDLVTILTACALGFNSELFVPLGALDNCSASFGLGATVAPRDGSPKIERWAAYISEAAQRFGIHGIRFTTPVALREELVRLALL